jgi:ABC-type multidrug transport system fused ATPase/permease subunit
MVVKGTFFILGSLCIMMWIQWRMGFVTFLSIIPIVLLNICYSRKMRVLQKEISSEKSKMTVIAEEALSNVRTVKAFASED